MANMGVAQLEEHRSDRVRAHLALARWKQIRFPITRGKKFTVLIVKRAKDRTCAVE